WMPGTLVTIGLNGPAFSWPGFKSNVSSWLGPPLIHSKMQERFRCGFLAASSARAPSQPDVEQPTTPAEVSFGHSRRECGARNAERGVRNVIGPSLLAFCVPCGGRLR